MQQSESAAPQGCSTAVSSSSKSTSTKRSRALASEAVEGNKATREHVEDQPDAAGKEGEEQSEKRRENASMDGSDAEDDENEDKDDKEVEEEVYEDWNVQRLLARAQVFNSEADYSLGKHFTILNLVEWGMQESNPGGDVVATWQKNSPEADFTNYVATIGTEYYIVCDPNDNDPKQEHCGSDVPLPLWTIEGFPLKFEEEKEKEIMSDEAFQRLSAHNAGLMEKEMEYAIKMAEFLEQAQEQEQEQDSDDSDYIDQGDGGAAGKDESGDWKHLKKRVVESKVLKRKSSSSSSSSQSYSGGVNIGLAMMELSGGEEKEEERDGFDSQEQQHNIWASGQESQGPIDGEADSDGIVGMDISPKKKNDGTGAHSGSTESLEEGQRKQSSVGNVLEKKKPHDAKRKLVFAERAEADKIPSLEEIDRGFDLEKQGILKTWKVHLDYVGDFVEDKFKTDHVVAGEYNYCLEYTFSESKGPVDLSLLGDNLLQPSFLYTAEQLIETLEQNLDISVVQIGVSKLILTVFITFNCCVKEKSNVKKTGRYKMGELHLIAKQLIVEEEEEGQIGRGEDIEQQQQQQLLLKQQASETKILRKAAVNNLNTCFSRHLPASDSRLSERRKRAVIPVERHLGEDAAAVGGRGEGGIEMFEEEDIDEGDYRAGSVLRVAAPVMVQVPLSEARKKYYGTLHHFELCLASHFAFVVKKMGQANQRARAEEGIILLGAAKPAGLGRIAWQQRFKRLGKDFRFDAERVLSFLWKMKDETIKSSMNRLFVKNLVLQSGNEGGGGGGGGGGAHFERVQFFFSEKAILAKGLFTFQTHVLEYVRGCMSDSRLIKANVKQTTIANPPKTMEQMINERLSKGKQKKGKIGQKQFQDQAFAVWQATRIPASGRGKVGAVASKDVVEKAGKAAIVYLKYLALLIKSELALSFVQSAIMLAEKEVAVTIAAFERNADSLRIISMSGNKDLIFRLMVQIKNTLDYSIPTFEKMIQFFYAGMLHDLRCEKDLSEVGKELTCVERRQMLFSSGILIQYLQGSFHAAIAFFFGGQRSQVHCKLQQISLRVCDEVDVAKMGELIVAGVVYMNGSFYFLICVDKVWRWSTAMLVPLPQPMTLILTLMYQYQIYIVQDRQKQFANVVKAQMAASAMVAKTAEKLLPKGNGKKKKKMKKGGDNDNNNINFDENLMIGDAQETLNHPHIDLLFSFNIAIVTGHVLETDEQQFCVWREKWHQLEDQSSSSSDSNLKVLQMQHLLSYLNHDMQWTGTQQLQVIVQAQDVFELMVNVLQMGPLLDASLFLDPAKMIGAGGGLALLGSGAGNVLLGLFGREFDFPREFIPNFGRLRIALANFQMLFLAQDAELFNSMCRMARHSVQIVRETYAPGTTMSQAELAVKRYGGMLGLHGGQWSTGTVEGSILKEKLDAEFQNRVEPKTQFYMTNLIKYMKSEGMIELMEDEDVDNMIANGKSGNTLDDLFERYEKDLEKLLVVGGEGGGGETGLGIGVGAPLGSFKAKINLPMPMKLFEKKCVCEDDLNCMPYCACCESVLEKLKMAKGDLTLRKGVLYYSDPGELDIPVKTYHLEGFTDGIVTDMESASPKGYDFLQSKPDNEMIVLLICKKWKFHENVLGSECTCQKSVAFVTQDSIGSREGSKSHDELLKWKVDHLMK